MSAKLTQGIFAICEGYIKTEPKLEYVGTNNTALCKFRLMVRRAAKAKDDEQQHIFFTVIAWGKYGERIHEEVKIGDAVKVRGIFDVREYERKDGGKGHDHELKADMVQLAEWPADGDEPAHGRDGAAVAAANRVQEAAKQRDAETQKIPF